MSQTITPHRIAEIRERLKAFETMRYGDRGTRLRWEAMVADQHALLDAYERLVQERDELKAAAEFTDREATALEAKLSAKEAQCRDISYVCHDQAHLLTVVRALEAQWRTAETEGDAHDPAVAFSQGVLQCADDLAAALRK